MLREEQANITTLKKIDTENFLCKEKIQEKTELSENEKEHKKYLKDQHNQEVHKPKREISCIKLELENYKAELPSTESYLGHVGTNKPKKKHSQAHKRSNLHIEKSSSNEKKENVQQPCC